MSAANRTQHTAQQAQCTPQAMGQCSRDAQWNCLGPPSRAHAAQPITHTFTFSVLSQNKATNAPIQERKSTQGTQTAAEGDSPGLVIAH